MNLDVLSALTLIPMLLFTNGKAAAFDIYDSSSSPVYLYSAPGGKFYTYDVATGSRNQLAGISRRAVTVDEIIKLEDSGVAVKIWDAGEGSGSFGTEETRKYSGSAPETVPPSMARLPTNFSIVQLSGLVYGNFYVPGNQPAIGFLQNLKFKYQSSSASTFGSHLAIALLLDSVQLTSNYPPTYAPAVVGNGMLIGNVAGTPNGCGYTGNRAPVYNMEIESFWNGGNKLFQNTCIPTGVADGLGYSVNLSARLDGYVAYSVSGASTWNSPNINTLPYRPSGTPGSLTGGGIVFAMVATPSAPEYVTMNFTNVSSVWIN